MLVLFSVVALAKAFSHSKGTVHPTLTWLTPTHFGGASALVDGLLAAVFIYWGWDTAASVNEECENANTTPGLASVLSTFILVAIFVVVAFAAQAVRGADFLSNNSDDVLNATGHLVFGGSGFGTVALKLLIIAVLTSSAASCQTTILPAAAPRSRWPSTGRSHRSSVRSTPSTSRPASRPGSSASDRACG